MFNSYNANAYSHQSIKINAVTGGILKNHPKSWFERFHLKSKRAEALLTEGGHIGGTEYINYGGSYGCHTKPVHDPEKDVVILQMMICGDMEVIAECVYQRDYDTMFSREGVDNGSGNK